jgi:hypothetical protein
VWFAATGYCIMANGLYWLGAEPRLKPETQARPASTDARELVPREHIHDAVPADRRL